MLRGNFWGSKKRQMFGLAIAGWNGLFVKYIKYWPEWTFFFWTASTFLSNYYGLNPFQGSVIL